MPQLEEYISDSLAETCSVEILYWSKKQAYFQWCFLGNNCQQWSFKEKQRLNSVGNNSQSNKGRTKITQKTNKNR